MKNITDQEYQDALCNTDFKKIMHSASKKYRKILSPQSIESIHLVSLWEALKDYDNSQSMFTTFLYQKVRFACLREINDLNKDQRNKDKLECLYRSKNRTNSIDIHRLMVELDDNDATLIQQRFIDNLTLTEIGKKHNVCKETIRKRLNKIIENIACNT